MCVISVQTIAFAGGQLLFRAVFSTRKKNVPKRLLKWVIVCKCSQNGYGQLKLSGVLPIP